MLIDKHWPLEVFRSRLRRLEKESDHTVFNGEDMLGMMVVLQADWNARDVAMVCARSKVPICC